MPGFQVTETVSLDEILTTANELNMSQEQTLNFLWGAIDLVKQKSKRVFSYSQPFATTDTDCGAQFARSFVHQDWIDGESVVQAETNTLEEGFNSRFHKIEDDLDALSADIAKAFVCLAEQRAEISKLLGEIRTEINLINGDIHDCCHKSDGTVVWPPYRPPQEWPPYYPPIDWPSAGGGYGSGGVVWPGTGGTGPIGPMDPVNPDWGGGYRLPYNPRQPWIYTIDIRGGGSQPWSPNNVDPVRRYLDTVSGLNTYTAPGGNILRSTSDPTRGLANGMPARLIEQTSLNGQTVEVWSTAMGLIMSPAAPGSAQTQRPSWTHPGLETADRYARWAATNEKTVTEKLGGEFALGTFIKAFGDEKLEGGLRLGDVMGSLTTNLHVKSPLGLVAPLVEQIGKAIVRDGLASEAVIGAVGLNADSKGGLSSAPVQLLKGLAPATGLGLTEAGVRTMEDLVKASPAALSAKLNSAGVKLGVADVAGLAALAAGVMALDQMARGMGKGPGA